VGELQQFATPEELYRRPATTFAAGFVGHPPMNLLAGNFGGGEFIADGLRIPLGRAVPEGPGHLGIRPEDAHLRGSIRGRVVLVESLGRQALVTLALNGVQAKVVVDGASRPALATEAHLGYDPAALHLFDATGKRIEA
ncbi:MAG: TOBE domain-containing protein, partial [bacterium]